MVADAASTATVAATFDRCADGCLRVGEVARRRDALIAAYSGADRHYHDIAHIAAMLRLLETHAPSHPNRVAIDWAILYHDVVYDPRRRDNEAASAAVMADDLAAMGVDAGLAQRVRELILATLHGEVAGTIDDATALVVDLDLAVLASAPADYDAYAAAIRREYAHVPEALYREGRARVLQGFIDKPAIYRTDTLRARWEVSARANLAREIGILRNG